jgi:8-oxo-dGTP pyrophosphatase MutT (NUDIX family)
MTAPAWTFVNDDGPLGFGDAVAALLLLPDDRCLLQHRDNIPNIWYPDHWGCFGGAIDEGETPSQAFARELMEELNFPLGVHVPFMRMNFEFAPFGGRSFIRQYYLVKVGEKDVPELILGEGQGIAAVSIRKALTEMALVPYDAFALFLYMSKQRLGLTELKF